MDENHVHRERLIKDWLHKEPYEETFSFEGSFKEKYKQFINTPCINILSRVYQDSTGARLPASPGLGLFASRNYSTQSIIGEYKGVISVHQPQSPYALSEGLESEEFRNEIPQVNDGFPNVAVIQIPNVQGLNFRRMMITLHIIKEGEQFCWNYGFHTVKLGPYVELRGKEMREFIKGNDTKKLAQCLFLNGTNSRHISFEDYVRAEQFRYVLQTPAALFLMALDGTIDEKKVRELNDLAYMMDCIPNSVPPILRTVADVAVECFKMKQSLRRLFPKTSQAYSKYFETLTSRIELKHVLDAAPQANKFLNDRLLQLESIGIFELEETTAVDKEFLRLWKNMEEKMNDMLSIKI